MLPQPDNGAALQFLRLWNTTGPWVLTSIQPDRKGIDTATFYPKDEKQLMEWLTKYNGQRNLYFHVNSVTHDLTKKAERTDIKSVDWLHVDIDPREGQEIEGEREYILSRLLDAKNRPKGVPEPTVVIFSGGGYQAFWKLEEPIVVDGDIGLAEDAKRYNQQLEMVYAADNCHNIDRIMRLPGTINIPDARKIKKGRSLELSKVLQFDAKKVYNLKSFVPAPTVQVKGETAYNGGLYRDEVKVSGNIRRLATVDELDEWDVPDRVKVVIVQGKHPEQPKEGDNSRSSWVFDCVCNLLRHDVPDEIIFSIITDPEFGIAESILEQRGGAEKYAIRQIERAKDWVIDPQLVKMNELYAVIGNMGGKCRIIEETLDEGLGRTRLTKQSFDDFRNRHRQLKIECGTTADGKPKFIPLGNWWIDHPKRRQYNNIVFSPARDIPGAYNLWRGFSCASRPGDCEQFLDHIKRNICNNREELYSYVIGWMARCVQYPASPGEVAIVLRGGRGVGKSFFAKQFGALFGRHFLQVSNSGHLVGNFNSHLRDVIVLFADEAFYAGDRRHASVLKTLITEETIPIEAKGMDVETAPNFVHLIMASNDLHVVPAGGDERRFVVLDVGKENQQDTNYFKSMIEVMERRGGREALLHYLMSYDLTDFEVRRFPETEALKEQKLLSLSPEEEWWYGKLMDGNLLPQHVGWKHEVVKDELVQDFVENAKRFNVTRRGNSTTLGRFLSRMIPELSQKQQMADIEVMGANGYPRIEKRRVYHYVVPSLERCRERWCLLFGREDWPAEVIEMPQKQLAQEPF